MSDQPAGEHHVGTLDLSGEGNAPASPIGDAVVDAAERTFWGLYGTEESFVIITSHYAMQKTLEAAYPAIRQQVAEEIAAKADAIAEECSDSAKIQRQLSIDKGGSRAGGASNMRTALALSHQAAGAWAVAEAAREIGGTA